MALNIYKTFTREKLVYQDLNALQQHYADYINDYCQSVADCVSTNTANKVVKRDASGNFAAGTITADLVGNVTGNADTATDVTTNIDGVAITDILEADGVTAKKTTGTERFQLSGCIGGTTEKSVAAYSVHTAQVIHVTIPVGKVLKLKRARYHVDSLSACKLRVNGATWASSSIFGDETGDTTVISSSGLQELEVSIFNNSASSANVGVYTAWWLDLAIEAP